MTSRVHIFPGFAHETSLKGDGRTLYTRRILVYTAVVAIIIYRSLSSGWTSSPIEIYRGHFDFSIDRVREKRQFRKFLKSEVRASRWYYNGTVWTRISASVCNTMWRAYNINEAFRNLIVIYRYYKYMSHARGK